MFGIAVGLNTPTLYAWTIDLSLEKLRGKAFATMYIALEIGIGGGAFFGGLIYSNEMANMKAAFLTCAVLSLVALFYLNYGLKWTQPISARISF